MFFALAFVELCSAIASIPLNYEEAGAIEEFEVTLDYQFFDARTTT